MRSLGRLDHIERAFSEAAIDPTRWDATMEIVADASGAYGAALFPVKGQLPNLPRSRSMEASYETYLRNGWIQRDERYRGWPHLLRKGVFTDFDLMSADDIARHPYYQEFLAPHGLRWFAGVRVDCGKEEWCLSIQRTIAQGPFSALEQRAFAALSTRLAGAAAMARALGFARTDAALAAFEVSGSAVVMMDRLGEVLRVNQAAERLLGWDLQISGKRLRCASREATAALDRALHALLWAPTSSTLAPPVLLPRRLGRAYLAYPMRLTGVSAGALAPCQALVVIVDPDMHPRPPDAALRIAFKLTPAEAKLAARLAGGHSLDTAADELGIAAGTARTQLKAIFVKTGTRRQAELGALLSRLLAAPHYGGKA